MRVLPEWMSDDAGLLSSWGQDVGPTEVRFGDVTLRAQSERPGSIAVASIEGWYDAARDATPTSPHPSGDGQVLGAPRFGARVIQIGGHVSGSRAEVQRAKDSLARQRQGVLVIAERSYGVSREAQARRTGLSFERVAPTFERFTLTLLAPDPLRHSTATVPLSNGPVPLANRGDAAAWPTIELTGPHGALSLTHPGGTFYFPALSAGQSRVIDCRDGVVWAGQVRVHGVGSGAWPRVPEGGASWTVTGIGSGGARVRRFEAWT